MHFVRTFSIMRACKRLNAIEEVRNYGKVVYIKNVFEKSGIFQSLGTINFVLFCRVKRGGGALHNALPPKSAPAGNS